MPATVPYLRTITRLSCLLLALLTPPVSAQQAGYDQPLRPQVHFSPQRSWTNDPNGLIYFEGEYHLFFQYNPFGDEWGHMSWGHAVSTDLLHWKELPVAIPEAHGEMIFTGSVVVDEGNTSGLCQGGKACLVAVYTGHRAEAKPVRQVQNIASSQDRGRTWQLYAGNPVLDLQMTDFRDPSVSWMPETKSWLMAVALPNEHQVLFYSSPDLKHWTRKGSFGPAGTVDGQWECPDLLHVPGAKGSPGMWALKVGLNPGSLQGGSGEQYFLGTFDGASFKQSPSPGSHGWTDFGKDSYCAISYNHLPSGADPVLLGWMSNWQYAAKLPTSPWRGQMTLARKLTILEDRAGLSLVQAPIVAPLRRMPSRGLDAALRGDSLKTDLLQTTAPVEITASFSPADAHSSGLRLYSDPAHWTEVGYNFERGIFYVDRTRSGTNLPKGFSARTEAPAVKGRPWDLHLIIDRSSIEAFAAGGTIAMTNLVLPSGTAARIEFFREGGQAPVHLVGEAWQLRSIWNPSAGGGTPPSKR